MKAPKLVLKVLAICMIVAMIAGCAQAPAATTVAPATSAPATAAPATAAPATAAPATAVPVSGNLSFLSWYTQAQMQPLLDAFKAKYPNVVMDFQYVPNENDQYTQKLNLLASSGQLPDLFYAQPPITLFAKNNYVADLSNLDAVKALPAGYTQSYTYNGKVYAYAPDAWVGGVFYNKDLFTKYNLSEPKTWADFLNICKTFKANGIAPISMSAQEIDDLVYWLHNTEVLSSDPGFDAKINTGETTFTQGYLAAFTSLKTDMIDPGYVTQDMVGMSDDQRMTEFATGKAAMTISGPWAISTFKQKNPAINLGIFPFVGSTADKSVTVGAVNVGIAISGTTKNMAAAEAFINFLGQADSLKTYQSITGNFMASTTLDYTVDPVMEPMKAFAQSGKFAFPPIIWTYTATIAPMFEKGTQQIVMGSTTPAQLVASIDAQEADLSK